ncbi:ABC transporter substrate-binding protein [Microbacterium aurantiacum]|uniref:ABC transporter substrate-binding protein n=1 Tax=Microbacterium aurantiacum TaxID=162393 RepID=UPI003430BC17
MSEDAFAELAPAWDGLPFTVHVRDALSTGLVEFGRWESVPRELARMALGALREGISILEFYWRGDRGRPGLCRTRMELCNEGSGDFVLLSGTPVEKLPHGLSARELEVLTLLVAGLSNAGIAQRLHLSARTVTTHVEAVMRKLDKPSRTAAATFALDEGILCFPFPQGEEELSLLRLGRALSAADAAAPLAADRVTADTRRRPLLLGAALPLSGSASDDGVEMLRGIELAVEEINAAGGVNGRSIRAEVVDVDIDDEMSVRRAMRALIDREVDALSSGYLAHQDVANECAADAGVPYLHAATMGAMERRVAADPGRYRRIFQVCPSDEQYAPRFVEFMSELQRSSRWFSRSNRLVVVQQTSWDLVDFGIDHARTVADRLGWRLDVIDVPHSFDPHGWSDAVVAALADEPAAIMLGTYIVSQQVAAVRALRDARSSALVYGIYAPSVPEFREQLGADADGVIWATTSGTYSDRIGLSFAQRFERRFGSFPGRSHAGIAYDRTHIIAQSWSRVSDFRDFDLVADRVRTSTYRGVNGSYYFSTPGQTALGFGGAGGSADLSLAQAHLIYQIQNGRQQIIDPVPYVTSGFQDVPGTTGHARKGTTPAVSERLAS